MNEENTSSEVSIYPNPASEHVFVNCHNNILSAKLYDVNGNEMLIKQDTRMFSGQTITDIDVRDFPIGIYFLKVTSSGETQTKKIEIIK